MHCWDSAVQKGEGLEGRHNESRETSTVAQETDWVKMWVINCDLKPVTQVSWSAEGEKRAF